LSKEKLLDRARDELFSHINRCAVIDAAEQDQNHWMDETIEYIGERYPDLTPLDLKGLREIGIRFCKPAIANGRENSAKKMADATAV
jgi:gamma-glutamylcysteine synthetase